MSEARHVSSEARHVFLNDKHLRLYGSSSCRIIKIKTFISLFSFWKPLQKTKKNPRTGSSSLQLLWTKIYGDKRLRRMINDFTKRRKVESQGLEKKYCWEASWQAQQILDILKNCKHQSKDWVKIKIDDLQTYF